MSDEKNTQPEIENENQELSEEELNDVAGGALTLGGNLISSDSQLNTFTGGVKPPSISSELMTGEKF